MNNKLKFTAQSEELQAILASVCYLEQESEKAGMPMVAHLFKKLIADIEQLMLSELIDDVEYIRQSVDSDLYKILLLLHKFSSPDKLNLESVIQAIENYGMQLKMAH